MNSAWCCLIWTGPVSTAAVAPLASVNLLCVVTETTPLLLRRNKYQAYECLIDMLCINKDLLHFEGICSLLV